MNRAFQVVPFSIILLAPLASVAQVATPRMMAGASVPIDAHYVFSLESGDAHVAVISKAGELFVHDVDSFRGGTPVVGSARRIPGNLIAADAKPTRACFALDATRIAVVNAAGEVWVHPVSGSRVSPPTRYGPAIIGGDARFIFALDATRIGVVNQKGELWVHPIRSTGMDWPARVPGALIGVGGSPAKFVFAIDPFTIAVVNAAGELWIHGVAAQVSNARGVGGFAIAVGGSPAQTVFAGTPSRLLVPNKAGNIWFHDLALPSSGGAARKTVGGSGLCVSSVVSEACGSQLVDCGTALVNCGMQTITDGARCGMKTVTSVADCGKTTFNDVAHCGTQCIGSGFTSCSCDVANSCKIAKQCDVPKTCSQVQRCSQTMRCVQASACPANLGTLLGSVTKSAGGVFTATAAQDGAITVSTLKSGVGQIQGLAATIGNSSFQSALKAAARLWSKAHWGEIQALVAAARDIQADSNGQAALQRLMLAAGKKTSSNDTQVLADLGTVLSRPSVRAVNAPALRGWTSAGVRSGWLTPTTLGDSLAFEDSIAPHVVRSYLVADSGGASSCTSACQYSDSTCVDGHTVNQCAFGNNGCLTMQNGVVCADDEFCADGACVTRSEADLTWTVGFASNAVVGVGASVLLGYGMNPAAQTQHVGWAEVGGLAGAAAGASAGFTMGFWYVTPDQLGGPSIGVQIGGDVVGGVGIDLQYSVPTDNDQVLAWQARMASQDPGQWAAPDGVMFVLGGGAEAEVAAVGGYGWTF